MRTLLNTAAVLLVLLLSGCTYAAGLGERAIIKAVFLDYENNAYQAVLTVFNCEPNSDTASAKGTVAMYAGSGATIEQALKAAEEQQMKQPFYAQNDLLFLGKGVLAQDISPCLNYFAQENAIRPNLSVYGVSQSSAEWQKLDRQMSALIDRAAREARRTALRNGSAKSLYQFFKEPHSSAAEWIPLFHIPSKGDRGLGIHRIAILKEGRLVKVLSASESDLFFLLANRQTNFSDSIGKLFYRIQNVRQKHELRFENQKPVLHITVTGTCAGLSYNATPLYGTAAEAAAVQISQQLEQRSYQLLRQLSAQQADLLQYIWWLQKEDAAMAHAFKQNPSWLSPETVRYHFLITPQRK